LESDIWHHDSGISPCYTENDQKQWFDVFGTGSEKLSGLIR
jgi:hypothetical protein